MKVTFCGEKRDASVYIVDIRKCKELLAKQHLIKYRHVLIKFAQFGDRLVLDWQGVNAEGKRLGWNPSSFHDLHKWKAVALAGEVFTLQRNTKPQAFISEYSVRISRGADKAAAYLRKIEALERDTVH